MRCSVCFTAAVIVFGSGAAGVIAADAETIDTSSVIEPSRAHAVLRVVMPFSCSRSGDDLTILPSQPRYYDVVGGSRSKSVELCSNAAAGGAGSSDRPRSSLTCFRTQVYDFDVACTGGKARWVEVAATGAAMFGGGVRLNRDVMRLQFRGRLRPWTAAPCLKGDWPHRGAPLAGGFDRFPDVGCEAMGAFEPADSSLILPKGFAPLIELGARLVPGPIFKIGTSQAPPLPIRPRAVPRLAGLATRLPPAVIEASLTGWAVPEPAEDQDSNFRMRDGSRAGKGLLELPGGQLGEQPGERVSASAEAGPAARPIAGQRYADEASGQATNRAAGDPIQVAGAAAPNVVPPVAAKPWTTLVEIQRYTPGEAQKSFERTMVVLLIALVLTAGTFSGLTWLWSERNRRPFRPADAYEMILRRDGVNLEQPDAQLCGELCRSAQALVLEVHDVIDKLQGVAPLRRTLLREIRDLEYYLSSVVATTPQDDTQWRRMRTKLQRIATDIMRLKDITESAHRSLSVAVVRRELPRDRSEAFEALGANPTTSDKILKRLVDALRATWHPDLAAGEDDRRAREDRIKQINVAWDIISGKRVEA